MKDVQMTKYYRFISQEEYDNLKSDGGRAINKKQWQTAFSE